MVKSVKSTDAFFMKMRANPLREVLRVCEAETGTGAGGARDGERIADESGLV